jgi:hypothetical protein
LAGATAAESPGAEGAIDFAHVVVEQNVGRAGRANAEERADNAGSGHGGFQHVGLKPLVEEVGGTHSHQLHQGVALVGRKFPEALQHEVQLLQILRIQRGRVRRNHGEHGFHEAAHGRHHLREFVVRLSVKA